MSDSKVLKTYCSVCNKYYGAVLAKKGMEWVVVDFIPIDSDSAKLICSPSSARQRTYKTNANLLPCLKTRSREICSCGSIRNSACKPNMKYNFQCLYCSELKVDWDKPRGAAGHHQGEFVQLEQGQVVRIEFDNKPLTNIKVGVGWDPVRAGSNMDVDSSVVVAGSNGYDLICFYNLKHETRCVIHHGDNLTGDGQGDDENISVDLKKVPASRDRLIFVINIYNCSARRQSLGDVRNMYINLTDVDSGNKLFEYKVQQDMLGKTAIVIGMAYRDGDGWVFKAIGKGSDAQTVESLAREVKDLR